MTEHSLHRFDPRAEAYPGAHEVVSESVGEDESRCQLVPASFPLIVLKIVQLYSLSLALSDPHSPVVQIFTYFPYSAPITAMLRNAFGSRSGWEAAIVIIELFLLSPVVLQIAARVFRYGSTSYTSKGFFNTVFVRPAGSATRK
ncbi:ABC transporter permease [Cryobacterium sp. Hh7]|uniref:ABC transporter permease n=1 Tax=Cryobacterium sp. Hh7 TaxID=1259159 RepID=UPI00141B3987|nr:ABC transporter permease [Cryobacterium sp. Hh7]